MRLLEVARHRAREVHRVLLPRSRSGRFEAECGRSMKCGHDGSSPGMPVVFATSLFSLVQSEVQGTVSSRLPTSWPERAARGCPVVGGAVGPGDGWASSATG